MHRSRRFRKYVQFCAIVTERLLYLPVMRHRSYQTQLGCSVEATLEVIGGKWKGAILYHLLDGTKRFNELKRMFPSLTQRILAQQLKDLERDGIVHREVYPEVPPKVEYSLSEMGRSLEPVLRALRQWGADHVNAVISNREGFSGNELSRKQQSKRQRPLGTI